VTLDITVRASENFLLFLLFLPGMHHCSDVLEWRCIYIYMCLIQEHQRTFGDALRLWFMNNPGTTQVVGLFGVYTGLGGALIASYQAIAGHSRT